MQEKAKNSKIIMYGSPACPHVPTMKSLLNQSKVDYEYINIFQDLSAREHVREINNGYESVPTFVFPGSEEPFSSPAAFFSSTEAGGVLVTKLNERSA